MNNIFRQCLWQNFGAAIDMLRNAVVLCPDNFWHEEKRFYYLAYHTTIFLDYYLSMPVRNFLAVLPYTLTEESMLPPEAVDDVMPERFYSRQDVLDYLAIVREKCKMLICGISDEGLLKNWIEKDEINLHVGCPSLVENYSVLEILFYNLRHVQHHTAQLNFILRQKLDVSGEWVAMVSEE